MSSVSSLRRGAIVGVLSVVAVACGGGDDEAAIQANSDAADNAIERALGDDQPVVTDPAQIAESDRIDPDIDWFACDDATFAGQPVENLLADLAVGAEVSVPPNQNGLDSAVSCSFVTSDVNPVSMSMNWNELKTGVDDTKSNVTAIKAEFGFETPNFQDVTIGGHPAVYYTDPNSNGGQWSISALAELPGIDLVMHVQTGDSEPTQAQISATLALLEAAAGNLA